MTQESDEMFDVWLANAVMTGRVGELAARVIRTEVDGLRAHIEWLIEQNGLNTVEDSEEQEL